MSLPILQPNSTPNEPQIRGDVTIDESVIVASGVILNATVGHKITVHAGVCLGMGTIITAHEGDVEIHANAILGPGTLILGNCVIGSQASLGTSVTVFHGTVESLAVIPAGSIIGDYSRQATIESNGNSASSNKHTATVNQTSANINITSVTAEVSQTVSEQKSTNLSDSQSSIDNNPDSEQSIIDKINKLNQNQHLGGKTIDNSQQESSSVKKPNITSESIKENIGSKPGLNSYVNQHNLPNKKSIPETPQQNTAEFTNQVAEIGDNTIDRQQISDPVIEKKPKITSADILPKPIKPQISKPKSVSQSDQINNNQPSSDSQASQIVQKKEVVGKVYINRLLYTLFPEKNKL